MAAADIADMGDMRDMGDTRDMRDAGDMRDTGDMRDAGDAGFEDGGRRAPLARTLALARPASGRLALAALLGAGAVGAGIGLIATSAWLISRASQRPQESALAVAIVAVQFFGLSRGVCRYGERLVAHDAAFRLLAGLRVDVYRRLERLAPAGLPAFRGGDLLVRLLDDVDALQDLLLRVIPPFAIAALVGAATVTLVWWMLPTAGLILLAALLLAATLVPWLTRGLARRREARLAGARGALAACVVDLVEGAPELLVSGAIEAQLGRAAAADEELTRIALASARTAGAGQGLTTLLCGLAMWGSLLVGVSAVRSGELAGVLLALVALAPLAAFELVTGLPIATQTLVRVRACAARVFDVCDAPAPVLDPPHPAPVPAPPHALRVRGLRARYTPDGPWALDRVDLELSPGRLVAVVGASGAGKSTLAEVLLRFLPYQEGSVTLNGVEVSELDGDRYRRVVGTVAQDAHIFDTTLRENLLLARRSAGARELDAALERVRLLDWARALPDGLLTEVGEHGTRISGGQRQRLAIARVLLAGFPILILDEPVEHLDMATADAISAELIDAGGDVATLLITHRLRGLELADEVLVLDRGRVLERGAHAELLGAGGRYAEMWAREVA
jgi:thiol reductant ABC exporter CydC subunit